MIIHKMNKKGQVFDRIGQLAVAIGVFAIVMVVGFLIMAQAQDQIVDVQDINESNQAEWTTAYNASTSLQSSLEDVPAWIPIVVVVAIGGILIALVSAFKGSRK